MAEPLTQTILEKPMPCAGGVEPAAVGASRGSARPSAERPRARPGPAGVGGRGRLPHRRARPRPPPRRRPAARAAGGAGRRAGQRPLLDPARGARRGHRHGRGGGPGGPRATVSIRRRPRRWGSTSSGSSGSARRGSRRRWRPPRCCSPAASPWWRSTSALPPLRGGRGVESSWLRLARAARAHDAALLVGSPYRVSGTAAAAVLKANRGRAAWRGGGVSPCLLDGFSARVELEKCRGRLPGQSEELRLLVEDLPRPALPPRQPARPSGRCRPVPAVQERAWPLRRAASA